MSEPRTTGILGHLRELRKRVLSVIAIMVGSVVGFIQPVYDWTIARITEPALDVAPAGFEFIYNRVAEGFSVGMRVSIMAGFLLAMPVIMYNVLMFILPALTTREKRTVLFILPWVLLMFFGGVLFAYYFLLPPAFSFLLKFGTNLSTPVRTMINLGDYVSFVLRLVLLVGGLFELPVVTTFLARMGIIGWRGLLGKEKIVVIGAFVGAAAITPTPDALNQTIVAGTIILLYQLSIALAWLVEKRKKKPAIT